jgi:hypothetical protein
MGDKKLYESAQILTILAGLILLLISHENATAQTKTVTTYVTNVQEDRDASRFTLTEWLRIKERMRWMDLWLAMFSEPAKKHRKFKPELNLEYSAISGAIGDKGTKGEDLQGLTGQNLAMQVWLTNLVSSTTGMRTINIDLGFEAQVFSMNLNAQQGNASTDDLAASFEPSTGSLASSSLRSEWSANLRLFGDHIQDSSLVGKYGRYTAEDSLYLEGQVDDRHQGEFYGGDLQLYLFSWLGLEGGGQIYKGHTNEQRTSKKGHFYNYGAFIEISLLRLLVSQYQESWLRDDAETTQESKGYMGGIKLQF